MNIFLRQEIERMQRVIGSVRSTLSDLKLAVDGALSCVFCFHVARKLRLQFFLRFLGTIIMNEVKFQHEISSCTESA